MSDFRALYREYAGDIHSSGVLHHTPNLDEILGVS